MNALRLQVPVIYKHFQTTFDKLNKAATSYKRINRRSSVIMIIIKSPSKATKSINLDSTLCRGGRGHCFREPMRGQSAGLPWRRTKWREPITIIARALWRHLQLCTVYNNISTSKRLYKIQLYVKILSLYNSSRIGITSIRKSPDQAMAGLDGDFTFILHRPTVYGNSLSQENTGKLLVLATCNLML